ncbi:MAG: helix-turn-helix domain-containing protein [Planctomycetes bacterium]|nr:helix-turn-helix domain-containing protein [Planctomycetota bacterium]
MNTVEAAAVLAIDELIGLEDLRFCTLRLEAGQERTTPAELGRTLAEVEQAHIERVLHDCGGNRSRAAQRLGIHRTTLLKKLRDVGLSPLASA